MSKLASKNLRLALTLTFISGVCWVIYFFVRTTQPLRIDTLVGRTVEPINLELRIDVAEEL